MIVIAESNKYVGLVGYLEWVLTSQLELGYVVLVSGFTIELLQLFQNSTIVNETN